MHADGPLRLNDAPQKSAWGKRGAVECRPSPEVPRSPFVDRRRAADCGAVSVMAIFRQQPFMVFTPSADYNVSRQVRDNLNLAHGGVMKRLYRIVTITAPLIVLVLQSAGAPDTPSKQIAAP